MLSHHSLVDRKILLHIFYIETDLIADHSSLSLLHRLCIDLRLFECFLCLRQMAGTEMIFFKFFENWLFLRFTLVHVVLTPVIERAVLWTQCRVRRKSVDRNQDSVTVIVQSRNRTKKSSRVRVFRILKQPLGVRRLHDSACIHDIDSLCESCDDSKVMGNDHDSRVRLLCDVTDHLKDLSLSRYIESRRRLICDKDRWLGGHCHRNHDSLTHTTGELLRIIGESLLCIRNVDHLHHLDRTFLCLFFAQMKMFDDIFLNLKSDCQNRV